MKVVGFELVDTGASEEEIAASQRLLGVQFPSEYGSLLQAYAGAYGDAVFTFPGSNSIGGVGHWLPLSPWSRASLWTSLSTWSTEHELPRKVLPVAEDGGGNCLCLDYRDSSNPKVVFWFHELLGEEGLREVSPSFGAFLRMLRAPEA